MGMFELPSHFCQEFAVPGHVIWMNIGRELKGSVGSLRHFEIAKESVALGCAEHSRFVPNLFPGPLRNRAKRGPFSRVGGGFPERQIDEGHKAVPGTSQRRNLTIGI